MISNQTLKQINTVPIGYSNLGYSGRAAYNDLNPRDGPPSLHNSNLVYNDLKI